MQPIFILIVCAALLSVASAGCHKKKIKSTSTSSTTSSTTEAPTVTTLPTTTELPLYPQCVNSYEYVVSLTIPASQKSVIVDLSPGSHGQHGPPCAHPCDVKFLVDDKLPDSLTIRGKYPSFEAEIRRHCNPCSLPAKLTEIWKCEYKETL